jgi:F0F1-type ATP synthase assembly protein I
VATEEPSSPPPQTPRKRPLGFLQQLALALELPVIPLAGVLAGGGLGYLIDARAHTRPIFTMVLGAAGVAAGIAEMIRRASRQG